MKNCYMYRICTEDLNRPGIECVMQNAGLDCTIIAARGLFQGIPENSLVIECVTDDYNAVCVAARAIVIINKQTCVLVERVAIAARMIQAEPARTVTRFDTAKIGPAFNAARDI
jgi:hypothetical protein